LFWPSFHVPPMRAIASRKGRICRSIRATASPDIFAIVQGRFASPASNRADCRSSIGRSSASSSATSRPRTCTAT